MRPLRSLETRLSSSTWTMAEGKTLRCWRGHWVSSSRNSNSKLLDVRQKNHLTILKTYIVNHKLESSAFFLIFVLSSFGKHSHDELSILVPLTQCCRSQLFLYNQPWCWICAGCKISRVSQILERNFLPPRLSPPAGWEGRPTFVCSCWRRRSTSCLCWWLNPWWGTVSVPSSSGLTWRPWTDDCARLVPPAVLPAFFTSTVGREGSVAPQSSTEASCSFWVEFDQRDD